MRRYGFRFTESIKDQNKIPINTFFVCSHIFSPTTVTVLSSAQMTIISYLFNLQKNPFS